jgi:hypothetical protein
VIIAARTSETSVKFYKIRLRNDPEDTNLHAETDLKEDVKCTELGVDTVHRRVLWYQVPRNGESPDDVSNIDYSRRTVLTSDVTN